MTDTMNTEKLKWYVEEYVGLGLKVLPVWGIKSQNGKYFCACPKGEHCDQQPGKHPLSVGKFISGVHTASDDIEALHAAIDLHPGMNLAIAVPDGMFVVDVDPRNGGDYQLQDIEAKHGKFPDTWDQLTGGGGRHLCYQVPQGLKFAGKLAPGIDIKQAGGYIMVEPSLHESGRTYDWEASSSPLDGISIETAPDWLLAMANRPTITSVSRAMATYSVDEVAMADLRSALTCVDPDDRETWVRVGHALKTIGDAGLDIWDQWSQRSPKYKASEIVYRWNGFAPKDITYKTVFHIAQEHGWTNTAKIRGKSEAPSIAMTLSDDDAAVQEDVQLPPSIPQHLIDTMPGMMATAFKWMERTAYRPLPELLAVSTISLLATAMGRIFSVEGKLRTNLMFVSAAGSGTGKEHGPTCVDQALTLAGCAGLVGAARIASAAGLVARLQKSPCTVYQIDEFGLRLQAMRAKNSGSHEKQIMVEMMELATSAHKIYRGTDYADADKDTQVMYPCMNLNATTTQAELFPALSGADILSGAINRMMIVFGPELAAHGQRPTSEDAPEELIEWIKRIRSGIAPLRGGEEITGAKARDVPVSPMASTLFDSFDASCVNRQHDLQKFNMTPLWLRGGVFARQLALVYAVSEVSDTDALATMIEQDTISISPSAAQWAIDFVRSVYGRMEVELKARISDSEFDKVVNDIVRIVKSKGKRGLSKREMGQYSRSFRSLKPREQEEVLQAASTVRGAITSVRIHPASGRGRPKDAYVATEFVDQEDA